MGRGGHCAGYLATLAIIWLALLSFAAWRLAVAESAAGTGHRRRAERRPRPMLSDASGRPREIGQPQPISGDWYTLGQFGSLRLGIGYYIDALTVAMFCMVTLVATCIHVYSFGYMHEELQEVTDPLVTLADGRPLRRRGGSTASIQYLSLFCFSMLGLVIAGNLAMVFVFWELVGICSYFLIGFYHRARKVPPTRPTRRSSSTAWAISA